MRPHMSREAIILWLAFTGLSACAGYGLREETAARAEQVFRRHNQAETRLLSALPALSIEQPEAYETLLEAEAGMLDACERLNELAIRRRDNKRIGIIEKWRVPRTIQACEQETQRVEELLEGI